MIKSSFRLAVVTFVILLLTFSLGIQTTEGTTVFTFYVDSFEDINDDILNSVCSIGEVTGGPCTLRGAIAEANAIIDTFDIVIDLPPGNYDLAIPPESNNGITSGDLNFQGDTSSHSITLRCTETQPAVIDANLLDRVFRIEPDAVLYLENIVVRGGLLSWTTYDPDFHDGAGILNYGTTYLTDVVVEDNEAKCDEESCPSIYISGGGILNTGRMVIVDSMIRNNKSVAASAISNAGGAGGLIIKNSTIYGNRASQGPTISSYAYMHFRNSTITGNTAAPSYIVGILNNDLLILESSTIANTGRSSSIYNSSSGTVRIKDSILHFKGSLGHGNCENSGTWISDGYNIYNDSTCPSIGAGDLIDTNILLGPLGNWGGPTLTMPLQSGSPAEDHRPGPCVTIPEGPTLPPEDLSEDQRHYLRDDGACDTGAFEGIVELLPVYLPMIVK